MESPWNVRHQWKLDRFREALKQRLEVVRSRRLFGHPPLPGSARVPSLLLERDLSKIRRFLCRLLGCRPAGGWRLADLPALGGADMYRLPPDLDRPFTPDSRVWNGGKTELSGHVWWIGENGPQRWPTKD